MAGITLFFWPLLPSWYLYADTDCKKRCRES
jgi:hypothetical protein